MTKISDSPAGSPGASETPLIVCRCGWTYRTEESFAGHQAVSTTGHWRVTPYPAAAGKDGGR